MTLTAEHLDLVLRSTDEVLAWIDALDDATRADVSPDWIARIRDAEHASPWTHGFVMIRRDSGETVGSCAFKGAPDAEHAVEIDYGVDPVHEGRGYATEAARALAGFALESEDVDVVRAHTRLDGHASMRVLEKAGFERIGEVIDPEDGLVLRWERRRAR